MTPDDLQSFLHERIPLTTAMQVAVKSCDRESVVLTAPLDANINHRSTLFGGSASALAILSTWSLVHLRVSADSPLETRIVIQRNAMEYLQPVSAEAEAVCLSPGESKWKHLLNGLHRKGLGRITLTSTLYSEGAAAARFQGTFVAIDPERRRKQQE